MRFTAQRKVLLAAVEKAAAPIPARSTLPILENVLLRASASDTITCTGTDLETTCIASCEAFEITSGSALVPAKRFITMLKNIDADMVTVFNPEITTGDTVQYAMHVVVETATGAYKLTGAQPAEYPTIPQPPVQYRIPVTPDLLAALRTAAPFVSTDMNRPAMQCIYLHTTPGGVSIASTDGHRLSYRQLPDESYRRYEYLLPPQPVKFAVKYGATQLCVLADDLLMFQAADLNVLFRPVDENYPNYRGVIPDTESIRFIGTANRLHLIKQLKRILPFASTQKCVQMQWESDTLRLYTGDRDFGAEVEEVMACSCSPVHDDAVLPFEIGFNINYLLDVLMSIAGDDVRFRFAGPSRAAVLVTDTPDQILLLMPIRLDVGNPSPDPEPEPIREQNAVADMLHDEDEIADACEEYEEEYEEEAQ